MCNYLLLFISRGEIIILESCQLVYPVMLFSFILYRAVIYDCVVSLWCRSVHCGGITSRIHRGLYLLWIAMIGIELLRREMNCIGCWMRYLLDIAIVHSSILRYMPSVIFISFICNWCYVATTRSTSLVCSVFGGCGYFPLHTILSLVI